LFLAKVSRTATVVLPKEDFMNETPRPDPQGALQYFRNKVSYTTGPVEVSHMLESGEDIIVIDVRAAEDYAKRHIPGSVNLPQEQWPTQDSLRKDRTNIVVCYSQQCHLAAKACVQFAGAGFPVMEMDGGFEAWKENDLKIEKGEAPSGQRKTTLEHSARTR
jgi:rhodanese-related sulfurtransferase